MFRNRNLIQAQSKPNVNMQSQHIQYLGPPFKGMSLEDMA